jgi:SAM-dependent methyltransferase
LRVPHQRELKRLLNERPADVLAEIDPADVMTDGTPGDPNYFGSAQRALRNVRLALLAAMKNDVRSILDLPSGHGRIMRVFAAAFPDAKLTACDTDAAGIEFCARKFGAVPVLSEPNPDDVEIEGPFDLIYCGSLLTHVDERGWDGFLRLFERVLDDDGVLVFTTGGRRFANQIRARRRLYGHTEEAALEMLAEYERNGFSYKQWPHADNYGVTMAAPWWTCRKLEQYPSLRLLSVTEQAPQDVIACLKGSVDDSFRVNR